MALTLKVADKRGKYRWTSSDGLCRTHLQPFLELKDNITVLWKVYSLAKHRRQLGAVDVQAFSIYCHLYHRKRRSVTIV